MNNEISIGLSSFHFFDNIPLKINDKFIPARIRYEKKINGKHSISVNIGRIYLNNHEYLTQYGYSENDRINRYRIKGEIKYNFLFFNSKSIRLSYGIGYAFSSITEHVHLHFFYNGNGNIIGENILIYNDDASGIGTDLTIKYIFLNRIVLAATINYNHFFNSYSRNSIEPILSIGYQF